ncbi:hypothetical protein LINPERHAP2_LOCUS27394 [Linum perenne]
MQDLSILSKGKINPLNQMPCCSIRVEFSTGRAPWQQAKVGSCSVDKQTTGHCAEDIELWMRNFGNEHQLVIVLYDDLNLIGKSSFRTLQHQHQYVLSAEEVEEIQFGSLVKV